VGGSSGGHSALRINDTVYHFQYFPNGLFKLVRERWSHFRYVYNDLENRTLYTANINVKENDLVVIRESLDQYYLIQNAHIARLKALTADANFIDDLYHGHNQISIEGVGFFSFKDSPDEISTQLQSAIINVYGKDYLVSAINNLDQEFLNIPFNVLRLKDLKINNDIYPAPVVTLSKKYAENRLKRTALYVLNRKLPLLKNELLDMDIFFRPPNNKKLTQKGLTQNERNKLVAYSEILKTSVIKLIKSNRPDWGYPLLLATARYQAVMLTLKHNRLFLLDPFPEVTVSASEKIIQEDLSVTIQLSDHARQTYLNIRKNIFAEQVLDEFSYNKLEEGAGRFAELAKGCMDGKAIRVAYGRLIPSRSGMVYFSKKNISQQMIIQALNSATFNQNIYFKKLKLSYPYHLITHNCATELIRNLNIAFNSTNGIVRALCKEIVPGKDLSFIPFCLSDLIKNRFQVTQVNILPGFRKRMLAQMTKDKFLNISIYLRECNTLTSTIYHGVKGDTPFLFFTDDVIWIRPVYGVINTLYGFLSATLGVFNLPLDGGDLSLEGLKGAMYSIPEIFFFNIRKGSFNYVDDSTDFK